MKALIITSLLFLSIVESNACSIKLVKTKESSKTHYLTSGVSLSKRSIVSLSETGCSFTVRVMNTKELRTFKINRAEKRLAKLKAGK